MLYNAGKALNSSKEEDKTKGNLSAHSHHFALRTLLKLELSEPPRTDDDVHVYQHMRITQCRNVRLDLKLGMLWKQFSVPAPTGINVRLRVSQYAASRNPQNKNRCPERALPARAFFTRGICYPKFQKSDYLAVPTTQMQEVASFSSLF